MAASFSGVAGGSVMAYPPAIRATRLDWAILRQLQRHDINSISAPEAYRYGQLAAVAIDWTGDAFRKVHRQHHLPP